jgi:hypothetical protein
MLIELAQARRLLERSLEGSEEAAAELAERWHEIVASCIADPALRAALRDLLLPLQATAEELEGAHWVSCILAAPHEDPFVAIEPASRSGIEGRMSGITDNFQLHMLLMDDFPGGGGGGLFRRGRRISKPAAAVARGAGPQQIDEIVVGAWNPYVYSALEDGGLPDPDDYTGSKHLWIWNEGTPQDIPRLGGHRVILLGPPSYERHWPATRVFGPLEATLDARVLSDEEVGSWLERIEAAAAESRQ